MSATNGTRGTPATIPYAIRGAYKAKLRTSWSLGCMSFLQKSAYLKKKTGDATSRHVARFNYAPCDLGRVALHHVRVPVRAVRLPAARHLPALDLDAELEDAALEDLAVEVDDRRGVARRRVESLLPHDGVGGGGSDGSRRNDSGGSERGEV